MEPGPSRPELIYKTLSPAMRLSLVEKRQLRLFAGRLLELTNGSLYTCFFADDAKLRTLNRDFLGQDYATDVISFPSGDQGHLGDIAISVQRAREQADRFSHATTDELGVLMLHGILHLLGFDHERDRGHMAREERKWRTLLSLPQTLIERSGKLKAERASQ